MSTCIQATCIQVTIFFPLGVQLALKKQEKKNEREKKKRKKEASCATYWENPDNNKRVFPSKRHQFPDILTWMQLGLERSSYWVSFIIVRILRGSSQKSFKNITERILTKRGQLLGSPPVPSIGKIMTKDQTKHHYTSHFPFSKLQNKF